MTALNENRSTPIVPDITSDPHGAAQGPSVLVVDDVEANARLAAKVLHGRGIEDVRILTDPGDVIDEIRARRPDLLLLDLRMPELDGFAVLDLLKDEVADDELLPVLVLTAEHDIEARRRALRSGALDYVTKPFDIEELAERSENLLRVRRMHDRQRTSAAHFAHVSEATRRALAEMKDDLKVIHDELQDQNVEGFLRLARTAELRDDDTGQHAARVGHMSALVARRLEQPEAYASLLEMSARLHDIGKVGIPDAILLKPGRLDTFERAEMERHCEIGAALLDGSESDLLQLARSVALTHHERWDGTGYPQGLQERDIPLEGRIVAVVDVFDALTHARPYKRPWGVEATIELITREAGRHFDPDVVVAFVTLVRDIRRDGIADLPEALSAYVQLEA